MRALIVTILLFTGLGIAGARAGSPSHEARAQEPAPDPAQDAAAEAEVLATVHALFDAMRAKDTVALAAVFHPDARLNTTAVRDGQPVVGGAPIDAFIRSIGSATADLDERLGGEEVRVDGGLATAWTPYAFFADGEFSHCGVNAFQLVRTDGGWKILQITDTRRREGCPADSPR